MIASTKVIIVNCRHSFCRPRTQSASTVRNSWSHVVPSLLDSRRRFRRLLGHWYESSNEAQNINFTIDILYRSFNYEFILNATKTGYCKKYCLNRWYRVPTSKSPPFHEDQYVHSLHCIRYFNTVLLYYIEQCYG